MTIAESAISRRVVAATAAFFVAVTLAVTVAALGSRQPAAAQPACEVMQAGAIQNGVTGPGVGASC